MRSTPLDKRIQQLEAELADLRSRLDHGQGSAAHDENRIGQSRDEWERTFDAIEDYVTILDAEKRIVRMNRAIRNAFASNPAETVGRFCYEVFWHRRTPCSGCPAILVQQDRRPHTAEFKNRRMGKNFLVSASPIFNNSGRLEGYVHVTKDITLQKKAEQELIEAYDNMECKVRERTAELALKSSNLEEANTALRLMLKAREEDRRELETRMLSSVHKLVRPYLDRLLQGRLTAVQKECVTMLENNIEQIMSPFGQHAVVARSEPDAPGNPDRQLDKKRPDNQGDGRAAEHLPACRGIPSRKHSRQTGPEKQESQPALAPAFVALKSQNAP